MALIKCEDCGTEVSDRADKCPKCACPTTSPQQSTFHSNLNNTQIIEQTNKKLKLQLLIGVIIAIVALPAWFFFDSFAIGISLFLIGAVIIIATKMSIWWHHH